MKLWLNEFFPNIPVLFSLGNNDVMVHDALSPGPNLDSKSLANIWLNDFSLIERKSFEFGGYWSTRISVNLKLISLNTLYFSKDNFLSESCTSETSPGMIQLDWLESELKLLKEKKSKAIIIGHIPPIDSFYHGNCLEKLINIFDIYSNDISCQIYGHLHIDDFLILKHNGVPVTAALVSPALSPVFNPSYRIYEFDDKNGSLLDYHQYYLNLQGDNSNFSHEYSCQEAFGNGPLNLEYFINLSLREERLSSLKIQRKRYKFVSY